MALTLADRVRDTTTTTGTGTVTLSGTAPTGYQNFSVIGNGNTTYYTINAGSQWEVGIGTYSSTGPTLSRDTVLESSNANALVDFAAGIKDVFVTYPSEKAVTTDGVETLTNKTINGSNNTITNVSLTTAVTGTLPVANGGTGVTTSTGTGRVVLNDSPVFVTPSLGAASATSITTQLGSVGAPSFSFTSDTNTGMWSPSSDAIAFSTAGSERLRVTSGGDVGIGTASPGARLAVTSSGSEVARFTTTGTDLFLRFVNSFDTNGYIGYQNAAMTFWTANTERMRIDGSGDVGIGVSTPGARLDASRGHTTNGLAGLVAFPQFAVTNPQNWGYPAGMLFRSPLQSGGAIANNAAIWGQWTSDNNAHLAFATTGAGTLAERMRIDSSGNVGIGTSSPGSFGRFVVVGSAGGAGVLALNTDATRADIQSFGNVPLAINRQGNNTLLNEGGGNVGIGTSSPGSALQVNGNIRVSNGTIFATGNSLIRSIQAMSGGANQFVSSSIDFYTATFTDNGQIALTTGGTERMRVDGSGNVGIGTSSPFADTGYTSVDIRGSTGGQINFGSGANRFGQISSDTTNGLTLNTISTRPLRFFTNGTEAARIDSSGNVGIGTTSPATRLHVQDTETTVRLTATSGRIWDLVSGGNGNVGANFFAIRDTSSGANVVQIAPQASEAMRIDSSGNVGIGTSSPSGYKTRILGGNDNTLLIDNDGSQYTSAWFANNGTTKAVLGYNNGTSDFAVLNTTASGNLLLGTVGTERMRINSAGNVGIGTSSFTDRLAVNGSVAVLAGSELKLLNSANSGFGSIVSAGGGSLSLRSYGNEMIQLNEDANILFKTSGGTERMRIDSSGNVGIGTSSPAARLDVIGNIFSRPGGSSGAVAELTADASSGANGVLLAAGFASGGFGPIRLLTSATERMRIDSSGNVGIGTSSPSARLHVRTASSGNTLPGNALGIFESDANNGLAISAPAANSAGVYFPRSTSAYYAGVERNGTNLVFANNDAERMRIDNSGNLLVGTTTNTGLVTFRQASSTATADIGLVNDANIVNYIFTGGSANAVTRWRNNLVLYTGGAQDILFETNATERMRLNSAGNLGLGVVPGANDFSAVLQTGWVGHGITPRGATNLVFNMNANHNGGGWRYGNNGAAALYIQSDVGHAWVTAPSGTAGNAITFTQAMTLDASGNLLVGKTAVAANVVGAELASTGRITSTLAGSTNATSTLEVYSTGAAAYRFFVDMAGTVNATSTSISAISDIRLKENVRDLDAGLDTILALKPRRFDWKEGKGKDIRDDMGFIAQEVEEVLPELIGAWKAGEGEPDDLKSVKAGDLIPVLVKAIQELTARVAQLEGN